ncbi:SPOR domain-containing protein [uncultured Hoeflea sp.]|uniref:SPOR domain-containing protein n=1 Tax=uncultured Hoeflea sp. TaxID=538666 RepID=UPI0030DD24B5
MADQFESTARSAHPDSEVDDPLAELARIIGYERPSEVTPAQEESSDSAEFDLEAELMRELDVPLAPSDEEIDSIEAEEALDVMLADTDFDLEAGETLPEAAQPAFHDEHADVPVDDAPQLDEVDFTNVEGRSSGELLRAIENETRFDHEPGSVGDETGIDDDWMMTLDADDAVTGPYTEEQDVADQGTQRNVAPAPDDIQAPAAPEVAAQNLGASDVLDDDVFADMARFELPSVQRTDPAEAGGPADAASQVAPDNGQSDAEIAREADEASLDFEEYLSTELDVFEQEVAMGGSGRRDDLDAAKYVHVADSDAERAVETALDALNDSGLDDEAAVFDEAAEELLAAIDDDQKSGIDNDPQNDGQDPWSLDNIEEAAAEELDEELDDMFGLPERAVSTSSERAEAPDELDLDLEQLLAESFDDDVEEDRVEPAEVTATTLQTEQVLESDDWLAASPAPAQEVSHDEMSEAFRGLAADIDEENPAPEPAAAASVHASARAAAAEPVQSDWLDGFETSEQGSAQPDESDYYFDAGLISEADETLEVVADIDVPELHHDEPVTVEPDYDTEIEREFAGIAERSDAHSDNGSVDGIGATLGVAEGWNRGTATPHAQEVSDEYIALERELGVGVDESTRTHDEGYGAAFADGDYDINDELAVDHREAENRSRGPVLAIAVLGIALLAGFGAFGWSMLSGGEATNDGGPRIIRADKDPVKVLPENPGGVTVPNQDKAVYDRVAGGTGASTGQPALVNSAEEPVDVVQRTLDPEILPLEGRADFSEKSEERLSAETSTEDVATNGAVAPVISPRKVRTMIVKPDGSIVAREVVEPEAAAAVEEAPQTPVSAEPAIDTPAQVAQSAEPVAEPTAAPVEPVEEQPEVAGTPVTEGTIAPVRVVTTQPIRPVANAPVPQGRPADQPVNVVGTVTQAGRVDAAPAVSAAPAAPQPVAVASAPVAAAPAAPAAAPVANPGGYYVQIASQPTVEGAQSSWRTLSSRYSSVLGGQSVDIQRADIPGKGVFHRVRVPAGSKDQANALCSRYKAAGGSCFVSR